VGQAETDRRTSAADEGRTLRLFRFRPVRPAFDSILRDVLLPDLAAVHGIDEIIVGRRGPGELGERLIATIWSSRAAMVASVGESFDEPVFHAELLDESTDRTLKVAPIVFDVGSTEPLEPSVVRLVLGRTKPDAHATYLEEARAGTDADLEAGRGPIRLCLADLGENRFATVSIWGQWDTVGEATGGSVADPTATRHSELLDEWQVDHYELVPGIPQPTTRG
jgi:hypothetical protein